MSKFVSIQIKGMPFENLFIQPAQMGTLGCGMNAINGEPQTVR
jgi:hypothetical protein